MRNMRAIPEVKLMMNALKLGALVRLLTVIAILGLSYCSLSTAGNGQSTALESAIATGIFAASQRDP